MKNTIPFLITLLVFPGLMAGQSTDDRCTEYDGAWIYDLPEYEGMGFAADGRVLWVGFRKDRPALDPEQATAAEKASIYEGMNIMVGNWTCDGERSTVTYEYASDPAMAGTSFSFDYDNDRHLQRYWVIGPDGNRMPEGRGHHVADLDAPTACGPAGGFWRYDLPEQEGYFAIAGNYWGWVIIDKDFWADPPDLSTEAGKAAAYDAINAAAGTYACDGKGNWAWNRTYANNPHWASVPLFTAIEINDPEMRWWFFDEDGERIQPGGRVVKVK